MKELKFKTNIKCQGCVDKIAPTLNAMSEIKSWKVDLTSVEKKIYIETSLTSEQVKNLIEKTGFKLNP